ncbi:MAG: carboxymuconolactone decarboxylase family protein [Candidatus Neomarinimicrobiota bacterium]|nr:MAG: carboxymuconolactone decarboxylase family protein [Candidatus Neomarinimicrobiota bacterium]
MGEKNQFEAFRSAMNRRILETGSLSTRRFFHLDSQVYEEGELPRKTKELLGLVASLVLRCDDCVKYHLLECRKEGWSRTAIMEACDIALVVGGSIVIPAFRRAVAFLDELDEEEPRL